jgi:hypothetical protein
MTCLIPGKDYGLFNVHCVFVVCIINLQQQSATIFKRCVVEERASGTIID